METALIWDTRIRKRGSLDWEGERKKQLKTIMPATWHTEIICCI